MLFTHRLPPMARSPSSSTSLPPFGPRSRSTSGPAPTARYNLATSKSVHPSPLRQHPDPWNLQLRTSIHQHQRPLRPIRQPSHQSLHQWLRCELELRATVGQRDQPSGHQTQHQDHGWSSHCHSKDLALLAGLLALDCFFWIIWRTSLPEQVFWLSQQRCQQLALPEHLQPLRSQPHLAHQYSSPGVLFLD